MYTQSGHKQIKHGSINTQLVTYVVPWEGHRQPGQKTAGRNKEAGRRKGGTKTSKKTGGHIYKNDTGRPDTKDRIQAGRTDNTEFG
jgi:hypothetical protein